ncbi:MAG TPA: hypothetical protein VFV66_08885 [Nonomuraea sp.]|nr:hypothetical protein [Nonomuraea sp.]
MKIRIAALIVVQCLAAALPMVPSSAASASTNPNPDRSDRTILSHTRRTLHFAPSGSATTYAGETCIWDVIIFRYDPTGRIAGQTYVECNAILAEIQTRVVLLNQGSERPETARNSSKSNDYFGGVESPPVQCLPGRNQAFGSVFVRNREGLTAAASGYSPSYITC